MLNLSRKKLMKKYFFQNVWISFDSLTLHWKTSTKSFICGVYPFLHVFLGVVLPGNTVSIPFSFKSVDAGIFSERWLLETQPVLLAGQQMEIVLKGIATKEDLYDTKRKEIEVRLFLLSRSFNL